MHHNIIFFLSLSDYFNYFKFCCTVDFHIIVRQYDGKKADILGLSMLHISLLLQKAIFWLHLLYAVTFEYKIFFKPTKLAEVFICKF